MTSHHAAKWWLEALACPSCRQPLINPSRCESCGRQYGADGGTPILIAPDARAKVSFDYLQSRSFKSAPEFEKYIRYPSRYGPSESAYHLDAGHEDVLATLPSGSRVLEIACGGGQMRGWFDQRHIEYVGTDLSKTAVHSWLQRFGGPDLLCDAHFLPFQDRSFDAVYSAASTQYMACPIQYFSEVYRVLKPGGWYLSNTAFLEPWNNSGHFNISPHGVIELLLAANFDISCVWPGYRYDGFAAMADFSLRGPFRVFKVLSYLTAAAYAAQSATRRAAHRIQGRVPADPIWDRAAVAASFDWIARRVPEVAGRSTPLPTVETIKEVSGHALGRSAGDIQVRERPLRPIGDDVAKYVIVDRSGKPLAMTLVSSPVAPGNVARAMAQARAAQEFLAPAGLSGVVLKPLSEGLVGDLSYAVLPYCTPLPHGRLSMFLRSAVRRAVIGWLREVTAYSLKLPSAEETSIRFEAPLERFSKISWVPSHLRDIASAALQDLQRGAWRPRTVLMHGDLWTGNILTSRRSGRFGFFLIDWPGMLLNGYGFYDLARLSRDIPGSDSALKKEFLWHCEALQSAPQQVNHYIAAAHAWIASHLEHFPQARFIETFNNCLAQASVLSV